MADSVSEFYSPRNTLPAKVEKVSSQTDNSPFIEIKPVVAVNSELGVKGSHVIVSRDAGRSVEDSRIGKKVVWGGELPGDIYGDRDQKGGRFERTFILTGGYQYGGWRVEGLLPYVPQEIDREEKATTIFRQIGLPTDVIRTIHILKELPGLKGNSFSISKWKETAINNLSKKLENDPEKEKKVASAKNWLLEQEFCIEGRDLQVAERLKSLGYCQTQVDIDAMVKPIFSWVNVATESRKSGLISETPQPKRFEFTDEDVKRYFGEWLPSQMGIYLGRLHKNQLVHQNATAQNWSAVGTLYDKDTVTGIPMGEKLPSNKQYTRDISCIMGDFDELLDPENGNYFSKKFGRELLLTAKALFLKSYLQEKHKGENKNFGILKSYLFNYKYDKHSQKWINYPIPDEDWKFMESLGLKTG